MTFRFAVGQAVEYRPMGKSVGLFAVIKHMPEEDGAVDRKYRIKSLQEGFERTVLECDLQVATQPAESYGKASKLWAGRQ